MRAPLASTKPSSILETFDAAASWVAAGGAATGCCEQAAAATARTKSPRIGTRIVFPRDDSPDMGSGMPANGNAFRLRRGYVPATMYALPIAWKIAGSQRLPERRYSTPNSNPMAKMAANIGRDVDAGAPKYFQCSGPKAYS